MRQAALSLAILAVGAGLLASAAARGGDEGRSIREGGTFRVSFWASDFDHIDPALSYGQPWALLDTTCATLMNYPDKPAPEGFRLVPEVAAAFPRVSRDAKTFTFKLRSDFRFSDGTPVRASAFARAIQRTLVPAMRSRRFFAPCPRRFRPIRRASAPFPRPARITSPSTAPDSVS